VTCSLSWDAVVDPWIERHASNLRSPVRVEGGRAPKPRVLGASRQLG